MEKDFDSKLKIQGTNNNDNNNSSNSSNGGASNNVQRSKSFAFRAPQENFTIQDFELGKIYGVGSYSKVVRAKKKDTGMVYALKIMDKKFITKENKTAYVKLERIVLDQLDHPGVVRLYFTFQDTFSLYMALESCEGGELFDQITRKGRLPEDEARFYAAEVVDALEYIHSMGLIHRDIKPENLLLTTDGHIKIADFGSVKPMQDSRITVLPNAASDDKACTFVGTAAYVPPEVLNSSPATFGNDLWALGCTLYQMLSGTSPFKDASEWLIFQRIIARDIRFPNYFSEEARDLIDRLLDIDPSRRPGAGPEGYAAVKMHPFFRGVDWSNLRSQTPPRLALETGAQSGDGDDHNDSSWNPTHIGDGSVRQNDGNGGASSSESSGHITRLASIDSFDSKWQQFLDQGESVLMISMVKKLQKLSSKKVQLILTNKPKLIYVDPSKLVVKGNIIWSDNSNDLSVQVTSPSHFKICTPKKVLSFEDAKQRAWQWKKAIEGLQNRFMMKTTAKLCIYRAVSPLKDFKKTSLNIIKEVNRRGPYIGLITVIPTEENSFFATRSFKPDPKHPFVDLSGRRFRVGKVQGKKVIYVRCGVGMVNAAAVTQQMLDLFDVEGIIHFGIAGNVNNSMSIGDVSIPGQVAHTGIWDWVNPQGKVDQDDVAQLDIGSYNVPKGNGTNLLGHIGYSKEQFFSESGNPNTAQPLLWANISQHWLQLAFNFGTSLSNGFPVIVVRGMSDLAGRQQGENAIGEFGSLAAINTAKAVLEFIGKLPS
ncbi:hypothetical protein CCACVL1_09183 [Corchorus capsularis]|uniref:non-specific serine/threonine protein kinase n=1 Tax=Corchorus capsularis TaxID=210143 RepID=A0A1R3IXB2_COCAP|nr:hypothetical protein CCACVL1_09183 [Corchorus capsularis]